MTLKTKTNKIYFKRKVNNKQKDQTRVTFVGVGFDIINCKNIIRRLVFG